MIVPSIKLPPWIGVTLVNTKFYIVGSIDSMGFGQSRLAHPTPTSRWGTPLFHPKVKKHIIKTFHTSTRGCKVYETSRFLYSARC